MLADYHVHTEFSFDSDYVMEEVVKDAIAKGLDEICFTDHVDYGLMLEYGSEGTTPKPDIHGNPRYNVDYQRYLETIGMLQEKYKGQIVLKRGLEYGMQMCHLEEYRQLYARYPLDFIIHSNHQVDDIELYWPEFFAGKTQKEYNRVYYEEILRTVTAFKDYSVLGHLDSMNRYDPLGPCPEEDFIDLVQEILKIAIADGKGIEINTSSTRYGLKDTTPSLSILKRYRQLGGSIITIGSDSHKKEHLGYGIKKTQELLKDLGFECFCTFKEMEPIFHKL
jgi:histidinol-phosphatase (PHP family)